MCAHNLQSGLEVIEDNHPIVDGSQGETRNLACTCIGSYQKIANSKMQ